MYALIGTSWLQATVLIDYVHSGDIVFFEPALGQVFDCCLSVWVFAHLGRIEKHAATLASITEFI